jgi:hypothetical protein
MKKFVAGSLGVLWLLAPHKAQGDSVRRVWYFEQLSRPLAPSASGLTRHQVGLGTVTYSDALSIGGTATVDLGPFEISASGSERLFFETNPEGVQLRAALEGERRSVGAEIARYRVNGRGIYGRLSLGVTVFQPVSLAFWKIALSTGVLPSPTSPWEFKLCLNIWFSFNRSKNYLLLSSETFRTFGLSKALLLDVGGFFTFAQALQTRSAGENILLSVGPLAGLQTSIGRLSVSVPLRIWLDKDAAGSFLTDVAPPAVRAEWQTVF